MTVPEKRVKDRRIQRTQTHLREALFSLIHDKSYDSIVVKEILDLANVGRSTFYTHFDDKDELLVSGMRDMLGSVQPSALPASAEAYERIIWFSLPIFEHIHHHRASGARIGTRGRAILHEHLQKVLAELIADDVRKYFERRRKTASRTPQDLLVQYVVSTFMLTLSWWGEVKDPLPPKDVNDFFRSLIVPTLAATVG